MLSLPERVAATDKTLAKYRNRAFDWSDRSTCIHLARAQARNMGHRVPKMPDFRSPLSARTALRKAGADDLEALLDGLFPRIAPAQMLVGDLAILPGDDSPFDSIVICDGLTKLFGWHGLDPSKLSTIARATGDIKAAWRL